ncbi:MAG TPA: peptidylprolyl isomerase [Roseiflexaceae bacterium]|nr:peptidylprolyl isomerase [Roseiflexaceae bacterium]
MHLTKWLAAILTLITLVACGPTAQTVARVDGVTLTRQALDEQVTRIEKGFQSQGAQGMPLPSRLEIEQEVVSRFIDQHLTLSVARQRGITVNDSEVDEQIAQFNEQIPQATGGTLEQAVQDQLGYAGVASTEFRQFVSYFVAQRKLAESLVSDADVRQRVTDEVMADTRRMVPVATVAHILVGTEEEALKVIERLDAGEDFAALAKELSQDPGSAQNGGVYENIPQGQFVPEFEQAMFVDLQPGETTKTPVQTQFGFHVIKLISRGEQPALDPAQAQQTIDQRVEQEIGMQRQQALQQLIADERTRAVAEQRIVEPTYPTPTPAPEQPAEPAAPQTATPAP